MGLGIGKVDKIVYDAEGSVELTWTSMFIQIQQKLFINKDYLSIVGITSEQEVQINVINLTNKVQKIIKLPDLFQVNWEGYTFVTVLNDTIYISRCDILNILGNTESNKTFVYSNNTETWDILSESYGFIENSAYINNLLTISKDDLNEFKLIDTVTFAETIIGPLTDPVLDYCIVNDKVYSIHTNAMCITVLDNYSLVFNTPNSITNIGEEYVSWSNVKINTHNNEVFIIAFFNEPQGISWYVLRLDKILGTVQTIYKITEEFYDNFYYSQLDPMYSTRLNQLNTNVFKRGIVVYKDQVIIPPFNEALKLYQVFDLKKGTRIYTTFIDLTGVWNIYGNKLLFINTTSLSMFKIKGKPILNYYQNSITQNNPFLIPDNRSVFNTLSNLLTIHSTKSYNVKSVTYQRYDRRDISEELTTYQAVVVALPDNFSILKTQFYYFTICFNEGLSTETHKYLPLIFNENTFNVPLDTENVQFAQNAGFGEGANGIYETTSWRFVDYVEDSYNDGFVNFTAEPRSDENKNALLIVSNLLDTKTFSYLSVNTLNIAGGISLDNSLKAFDTVIYTSPFNTNDSIYIGKGVFKIGNVNLLDYNFLRIHTPSIQDLEGITKVNGKEPTFTSIRGTICNNIVSGGDAFEDFINLPMAYSYPCSSLINDNFSVVSNLEHCQNTLHTSNNLLFSVNNYTGKETGSISITKDTVLSNGGTIIDTAFSEYAKYKGFFSGVLKSGDIIDQITSMQPYAYSIPASTDLPIRCGINLPFKLNEKDMILLTWYYKTNTGTYIHTENSNHVLLVSIDDIYKNTTIFSYLSMWQEPDIARHIYRNSISLIKNVNDQVAIVNHNMFINNSDIDSFEFHFTATVIGI